MHLRSFLIAAALAALSFPAWAACEAPDGCPDSAPMLVASAEPVAAALQIAQLPAEVVPALAPGEAGTAPARVSATLSEGRPASLVIRPEAGRTGARASAGERGAEQRSAPGSEPSSVWLMLFAGLAFAGFVVAKRSKS
ncbi:MAG TPA: PEP-CTERM sorting domain-containing protein [Burkholderiales bacterium]|nr:PEP-CTERM sorting domain-containing protein [Burkholderiales bacterium]